MSDLQEHIDRWETWLASAHGCDFDHDTMQAILHVNEAARLAANGKEVWLCGTGSGPMRPGKRLDLSCIYAKGHFEACGRYIQAALTPGDTDGN